LITVPTGRYISTGSSIHAIDPSAKIVSFILLAFSSLFLKEPVDFLVYGALWTAIYILSAVALGEYLSTLWGIRFLLLLVLVFQSFFTPGRVLLDLGVVRITVEGLLNGLTQSGRLIFAVLFGTTLSLTTSPVEISTGFERILKRLGLGESRASKIGLAASLTLTFIPLISLQTERIIMAQKVRGVEFDKGGLFKKVKNALSVVIPVIVTSLKKAQDTAAALQIHFRSSNRTGIHLRVSRWKLPENLLTATAFMALLGVILL
jgi:energy-coupling factor transport system permease protein